MRRRSLFALAGVLIALGIPTVAGGPQPPPLAVGALRRIATVDERYQSYNVEMAEVTGGNFWKPYRNGAAAKPNKPAAAPGAQPAGMDPSMFQARPPIDLANARLRRLAAALGPAYLRTSGTWANMVYFHDADTPPPAAAPAGFQGVLTRSQWKGVVDFARAVDARLVTSFAIGQGVRDRSGTWTSAQAERLVAYTRSIGGEIAAAEFFNEPNLPSFGGAPAGYAAADYARDFAIFRSFAKTAAPGMHIAGPGSVGEGVLMSAAEGGAAPAGALSTADILSASPRPAFDVFSYHFYGAVSQRCASMGAAAQTTAAAALGDEWLSRTEREFSVYRSFHDRLDRQLPIWITETAESACGGNPWAASFLDTFRYVDQLARLARHGVNTVFHNTLAASEYGLLDQNGFAPRPNYWAALLWRRLMGTTVLDAGTRAGISLYAQCLPGRPGGVTILAINASRTEEQTLDLPSAADRYTLTAAKLESGEVRLNGRALALGPGDALPDLQPRRVAAGAVKLAPASITFLAIPDASNGNCGRQ